MRYKTPQLAALKKSMVHLLRGMRPRINFCYGQFGNPGCPVSTTYDGFQFGGLLLLELSVRYLANLPCKPDFLCYLRAVRLALISVHLLGGWQLEKCDSATWISRSLSERPGSTFETICYVSRLCV